MTRLAYIALYGLVLLAFISGCPRDTEGASEKAVDVITAEQDDHQPPDTSTDVDEVADKQATDEDAETAVEPGEETAEEISENDSGETEVGEPAEEEPDDSEEAVAMDGDKVITVVLETTKGEIMLEVHPGWSPIGAAHFIELVEVGYYNNAPWFRVIDGFMCQTGLAADPGMSAEWQEKTIEDEPTVQGNKRGYVSFGRSDAPNSRSTHFFINFVDNSRLDGQGFPAFAVVVEGMEVAESLFITGENPPDMQPRLAEEGISFFHERYPEGDIIINAHIM